VYVDPTEISIGTFLIAFFEDFLKLLFFSKFDCVENFLRNPLVGFSSFGESISTFSFHFTFTKLLDTVGFAVPN
jgi:hypothetical protein